MGKSILIYKERLKIEEDIIIIHKYIKLDLCYKESKVMGENCL